MAHAEWDIAGRYFQTVCTNKADDRRDGAARCTACVTPGGLIPNGCRTKWTPEPTLLWQSTLNGFNGDAAMDRPNLGSIPGNDVLSGDPWGLQQDGIGLAFSQPSETAGPLVVGKNLDAFSVGQMPQLPWLFTGDPESQCIDFVGTSVPQTTNQVVRENTTAIPANLTDADIVAAGAANNWPGAFGVAEVFGPVLSFSYSETFDAQARFTIADGEHRLSFVISIEVGARQSVKVAKLRVTGTHPNRVGVFSISNPEGGGFPTDNYSLTFDWRWNSIPRPTTYYTDNQTQTETMAETSVFAGKGWTASGERFGYSGAGPVVPGAPANGTVTLPTFSNITWRRFG